MNRDLTVGKPESVLWRFCMPLFGSIVFQQLYNIADSLVAGKFIGENALKKYGAEQIAEVGATLIVEDVFGYDVDAAKLEG